MKGADLPPFRLSVLDVFFNVALLHDSVTIIKLWASGKLVACGGVPNFYFYLLRHLSHPMGGAVAEIRAFGGPGPCQSAEEGGDTCSATK